MSFNQAKMATTVAVMLSSTISFAGTFQKGFYIGVNSGASFVTGQPHTELERGSEFLGFLEDSIGHGIVDGFSDSILYRDEGSARGYNGGLFVGWNFYCDREFIYGLEVSGNLYSNRAYQTFWTYGENSFLNFEESWDLSYSAELTFKPGWRVSQSTELFAIIGGSVAQVNVQLKNLHSDTLTVGDPLIVTDQKTIYGFVIGAGLQKQITDHCSALASYQYTYYGKASSLSDGVEGNSIESRQPEDFATHLVNRSLRIDTNVFKVGLVYTF